MDIYLFYAHSFLIFTCLLCYGDCYKYVVNWGVRKSVIGNLFFTLFRYHYFKRGLVVPSSCLRSAFAFAFAPKVEARCTQNGMKKLSTTPIKLADEPQLFCPFSLPFFSSAFTSFDKIEPIL